MMSCHMALLVTSQQQQRGNLLLRQFASTLTVRLLAGSWSSRRQSTQGKQSVAVTSAMAE